MEHFTIIDRATTEAPCAEELFRKFPSLRDNKRLIITYYPNVYVYGGILPPQLKAHELIHIEQQSVLTPERWWYQYLNDSEFRLSQEIEAYAHQLIQYDAFPKRIREYSKFMIAQDLSSEFYGNIISFGEAESRINKYAKSIRENEAKNKKETNPSSALFSGGGTK